MALHVLRPAEWVAVAADMVVIMVVPIYALAVVWCVNINLMVVVIALCRDKTQVVAVIIFVPNVIKVWGFQNIPSNLIIGIDTGPALGTAAVKQKIIVKI